MSIIEERVAVGVEWLNENYPNWREQIDPARLQMSDPCHCILGQLEGNFYHVVIDVYGDDYFETACETPEWAIGHGFDGDDYGGLLDEWFRALDET